MRKTDPKVPIYEWISILLSPLLTEIQVHDTCVKSLDRIELCDSGLVQSIYIPPGAAGKEKEQREGYKWTFSLSYGTKNEKGEKQMKTKRFNKKLVLNKATIVNLDGNIMGNAKGGNTVTCACPTAWDPTCVTACPHNCPPPPVVTDETVIPYPGGGCCPPGGS
jgi:hypothetical protein